MLVVGSSLDMSSSDCFHSVACMAEGQPVVLCVLSCFAVMSDSQTTVRILAHQPPWLVGFSRQEYQGSHALLKGSSQPKGLNPCFLCLLRLAGGFFTNSAPGKPHIGGLPIPLQVPLFRIPSSFCIATGLPCFPPPPTTPPMRKTWDFAIRFLIPLCPFYYRSLQGKVTFQKKNSRKFTLCQFASFKSWLSSVYLCFCPKALKYLFQHFCPRAYVVVSGKVSLLRAYSSIWRWNASTFAFHLLPLWHLLLMQNFLLYYAMLELCLSLCLITF